MLVQSQPTLFMSRIRLFGRGTPLIHIPQVDAPALPVDIVNPITRPIISAQQVTIMAPRLQRSHVLRRSMVIPQKPTKNKRRIFKKYTE